MPRTPPTLPFRCRHLAQLDESFRSRFILASFIFASSDDLNSSLWAGRLLKVYSMKKKDVFTFIQVLIAVINRHSQT